MSRNKKTSESLFQFMNHHIALLQKNGQYRTSLHYKATLNSFKRYRDNKDIALSEIDVEVMRSYEAIDKMKGTVRLYRNAEARISYHLRKLGTKIGIKGKLTLYVARHSWATAARDNHISISVISEALGHHSEATTQIYLSSIKSSEVDDANAKILSVL